MIKLKEILAAWNTPDFEETFKRHINQLDVDTLPLQQALTNSSYTNGDNRKVIIMSVKDESEYLCIKTGIFYTGIVSGCNCADDPSPIDEVTEYCELQFDVNKITAEATIKLLIS